MMITDDTRKLFKESRSARVWIQMVLDHLAVQALLVVHTFLRTVRDGESFEFPVEYRVLAITTFLLMTIIYNTVGVYRRGDVKNDYISCLLQGWGVLVLVLGLFGFITKTSEAFSREVILAWSVTGFFAQLFIFFLTQKVLLRTFSETIPSLLVGSGDLGKHIASHINSNQWIPDQIVGVIDDSPESDSDWQAIGAPYLGELKDIHLIVKQYEVRRIYIAMSMANSRMVQSLAQDLVDANVDVIWAPDIFGVSLLNYSIKELAGVPLISLSETPLLGGSALVKTMMDKFAAFAAIILISPIMILTAILVKATSPGPVLFKQMRHGWDGRILEIYKFRSMKTHQEIDGKVTQAKKDDDRITGVGKFIRRTSIDELPQLFNVLGGSMSLVGPRPHAIAHNEFYKGKINAYMSRHRIKPGLTGLAQINGFRGETDTIDKMQNRVDYDLAYINNWSIWLDVEILFRTIFVLFGKNAY